MHHPARRPRRVLAAIVAALLAIGVSACAPEPGDSEVIAGQGGKGSDPAQQESSWSQPDPGFEAEQRQTTLPEGFPVADFPIPDDAVIYDAGATSSGWFVVLRAAEAAEAQAEWESIIALSSLSPLGEAQQTSAEEGGLWLELESDTFTGLAMMIPQPDGSALLSYELTPRA